MVSFRGYYKVLALRQAQRDKVGRGMSYYHHLAFLSFVFLSFRTQREISRLCYPFRVLCFDGFMLA